jgi:aminoglycoside phosphotransferase (APT) family kinase protein
VTDLPLLGAGRTADVFAVDEERVLRRYRDGFDVSIEAATMAHAAAHGYPVPRVHRAAGPDLVMDRVDGPTLKASLSTGATRIDEAGLADLLGRLNAVPPMAGAEPGHRVLRLDLHPGNVLLGPAGPVVIDWRNAGAGPPELDAAMSAVIIAQAATEGTSQVVAGVRAMLTALLGALAVDPMPALDAAIALRASDPFLSVHEVALLTAVRPLILEHRRPG